MLLQPSCEREAAETATTGVGRAATMPVFPLSVSSNGRYLVDAAGKPFRVHGDTAWTAATDLTLSDWRSYLDDRKSRGFNTVMVQISNPVKYRSGSPAPGAVGAGGALPFLKNVSGGTWDGDPVFANDMYANNPAPGNFDANFSSPNPQYFSWIDTLLNEAASRGIVVFLVPCYLGYNNGAQDGWWRTLNNAANTQSVSFGFGQYLGNRYKGFTNIVWSMGVDMLPPAGSEGETRALKILQGIKAAGDTHLWTGHWKHDYLATDSAAFASSMNIEGVYTHGPYPSIGPTYGRSRQAYGRSPARPAVLLETNYEGEHAASPSDVRYFMWGAHLSAVGGAIFGNNPIWLFGSGWQSQLNSTGSRDMDRMGDFFDAFPWQTMVPSGLAGMKTLVVGGAGTFTSMPSQGDPESGGMDWVVSAATSDGNYLIAYVPDAHSGTITIDMTALSGSRRARWFDPTNAAFTDIGLFPNTGSRVFTPPSRNSGGARDWVLFIDPPSSGSPPTVSAPASASPNPVAGTTTNLTVIGSDDGGEASLTYTWAAIGAPPAPVSFSANGTNAAKSSTATFTRAGSYTLQATIADAQAQTATSSVTVTVSQTATTVAVSPATASVATGGSQQFTGVVRDQFGVDLSPQPALSWTVSGGGTISSTGLFTAGGAAGGPFTVTAASGGKSSTASVTVTGGGGGGGAALPAQADAFVRDGIYASTNYGGQDGLDSKSATPDYNRYIHLRFDTASVTGAISSAKLRLFGEVSVAESITVQAFGVASTSWSETALTWNTQPSPSTGALASVVVSSTTSQWYEWDVTSYVQSERAAGRTVIGLLVKNPSSSTNVTSFNSKEATSNRPELVVTGSGNAAPGVASPASASPNPVSGNSTSLAVLGSDDGGEGSLTYTWAATGTPPAPVSFSANGSNAAKNTTATFTRAGSYALQVTIADTQAKTATSSVTVTVNQTATTVAVSPATASVPTGGSQQFTAAVRDQFGNDLSPQPALSWSVSGGGSISSSGLFTAGGTAGGPFTVTATGGGRSGTASVSVTGGAAVNLGPTADANVRDGSYGDTNFGSDPELGAKTSTAGYSRRSFLKFDTSSVSGSISSVKLRLLGDATAAPGNSVSVYSVASTSWAENTVTWNNQPAAGGALSSVTVTNTPDQWYEWDVTAYVKAEKAAGHQVVSLMVTAPGFSDIYCAFNAKEAASNPPQLRISP